MTDDDAPRIRLWGDSTKGHRVHPGTSVRPVAPVDLATVALERPHPTPTSTAEPTRGTTPMRIRVVTDDGTPVAFACIEIVENGAVFATDATGTTSFELREGMHELRWAEPPKLPAPELLKQPQVTRTILLEAHRAESFWLSTGERTIAIRRPRTVEVLLDGYAMGSVVMRWGGTRPRIERIDGVMTPVVGTARGAIAAFLIRAQGRHALVVGHADPAGTDATNADVAGARALSTYLYLAGEHGDWSEHSASHASETDFACALSATAEILGNERPALDDGAALRAACAELRRFGAQDGGMSNPCGTPDEWRLVAELYDRDLARLIGLDDIDLQRLRGRVTWIGVGHDELGETWPRDTTELDEPSQIGLPYVLACRRNSLHIMGPADVDALAAGETAALYDGTFARTIVEAPSEVVVRLRCTDLNGAPLANARAWIRGPLGVTPHVADAAGIVSFLALRHSSFEVVLARRSDDSGTLIETKETP